VICGGSRLLSLLAVAGEDFRSPRLRFIYQPSTICHQPSAFCPLSAAPLP